MTTLNAHPDPLDPGRGFLGLARRRPVPPAPTPRAAEVRPEPPSPAARPELRADRAPLADASPIRPSERALVLVAVRDLEARRVGASLVTLSVRCWELWPEVFSLGTTPHPDSAKVNARIADLVASGQLTRNRMGFVELPRRRARRSP